MGKEYKSKVTNRIARPRSKRLREQGTGESGISTTIVSISGSASTLPGEGHTHNNKTVLDEISTDASRYIYLTRLEKNEDETEYEKITGKAKAGYADKSGYTDEAKHALEADHALEANHAHMAYDLDADSPAFDKVLSSVEDDEAAGLLTLRKGLISKGLTKAEAGLKVISGTATDTLIASGNIDGKNITASETVSGRNVTATEKVSGKTVVASGAVKGNYVDATEDVSGKNVIASEGVGARIVTATDTVTGNHVVATETVSGKNVVVSEKVTTLNLLVQALAGTYDLNVSHVATLFRTTIKDYISSEQFIPGFTGNGMKLYKALSGDWNLELDNLTVRKAMTVFELIISKIRAVNGGLVISPANGKIKSVLLSNGVYRLEIEDDMMFVADDLVRCQSFSVKSGVKYYWVRITSVSGSYIFINATEFTNSLPTVGDDLVQFGNKTNKLRQGLLYLTAAEDGKPRISVLDGVNSADLTGKTKVILGCLDAIVDSDFPADSQPSGYGLYAQNVFLKGMFILRNGKTVESEFNTTNAAVKAAQSVADAAKSAAGTAQTTANTAVTNAATANTLLADLASDNKLTATEKQQTQKEWEAIVSEKVKNDASADKFSVSKTAYGTAYAALNTYITPLLSSLTTTTAITGTDFRAKFKAYYDARTDLLNAISAKVKTLADTAQAKADNAANAASAAQTKANEASTAAGSAQTAANNAQSSANSANSLLTDIANDNKLTPTEKQSTKKEWDIIASEKPLNNAAAVKFGITTTTYDTAYNTLNTYITPLLVVLTTTSNITGTDFRAKFKAYYDARTNLLNAISAKAKALADEAQASVDNLRVGGRNLLPNSDFSKNNLTGWFASVDVNYTRSIENGALKIVGKVGRTSTELNNSWNTAWYVAPYSFNEASDYTLSFEAYALTACTLYFRANYGAVEANGGFVQIATKPQRYSVVFKNITTDAGSRLLGFVLSVATTLFIDNIQLEIGNKATDWTPAPEDIENRITTVETNFEIREGQISAKVTEVTTKATQAATSATNAKTSETNASGSATTAGQKATAAANSATAAAGSATAAKKSADNAGTILEEVTVKESSITQTAGQISTKVTEVNTKVTEANTAATNAKKSETNAGSSATSASGSASTATTKANAASSSATAAAGSATTAGTKAGEAATSATNAKSSADTAAAKLTTITEKESSINQTASQISTKVTEVTQKATEASTSATNAASSATSASGSASTATTKANAASSSATAAAGSASTAGTKATAAAGSATAAATSATNAKNSADSASAKLTTITQKESSINQTASNITLQVTEVTTKASQASSSATNAANAAELAVAMSQGKMLYRDPSFEKGNNSVSAYNNLGNGVVTVTRVSGIAGNPNGSGYCLKITTTAAASPNWGGFYWGSSAKANRILVVRFIANIPTGRTLVFATNAIGTGSTTKWLTNNVGAGKWQEYAYKIVCGTSGTFSSTAYYSLSGGTTPTASAPLVWYLAYATVYDVTDAEVDYISDAAAKYTTKTEHSSSITQLSDKIELKVAKTDFNALGNRVSTAETTITQHTGQIALKAAQSDVTALGTRMNSAEAKITPDAIKLTVKSQTETISANAANAVQVGGRNLLTGSDFKTLNSSYYYSGNSNTYTLSLDNGMLKVEGKAVGSSSLYTIVKQLLHNESEDYIFSFDAYALAETTISARFGYGAVQSGGTALIGKTKKRYSLKLKGVYNSDTYNVFLFWFDKVTTVWFDNMKLEKGNKATDWTPAPEDVATDATTKANDAKQVAITDAASKYTTKTEHSSSITQLNSSIALKVAKTDFNALGTRVSSAETTIKQHTGQIALKATQSDVTALGTRMSSAEAKITPDAIKLTVKSQTDSIAATAAKRTEVWVDATTLDVNKYYPVTMLLSTSVGAYTISVDRVLYTAYGKPSWSTHAEGFSVLCRWTTNASGWGGREVKRTILDYTYSFANVVPVGSIGQMINSSNEYIYVRGGSKYRVVIEGATGVSIVLRTEAYTASSQTVNIATSVTTPIPDLSQRPTVDTIKSEFTIDAGGISILGKKIALTGMVTFSSLDSAAQSTINGKATPAQVATAKSEAISAASSDATTKANNAKTAAISSSATTAQTKVDALKGTLKSLAYLDTIGTAKLDSTVIDGGYLKTTLIKASSIDAGKIAANAITAVKIAAGVIDATKINVASIQAAVVTAAKIAALDITTNKLTVISGAKIGGWSIEGDSLAIRSAASAKILVEPSGTRFLRINDSTSELMTIRADGVTGLRIYTQDTTGRCLYMTAQTGGTAIESYGNHNFTARQGEKTIFEGYTNTGGLGVMARRITGTTTLDHSDCWVSCNNTGTITVYLPSNPQVGKMLFIMRVNNATVNVNGNGKSIRFWTATQSTAAISNTGEIDIYVYDGQYWMNGWFKI